MNHLAVQRFQRVPDTIQNAVRYAAADQGKTWMKQYLSVVALEQLRRVGGKASVGFLVNALAPGIITRISSNSSVNGETGRYPRVGWKSNRGLHYAIP